MKKIVYFLLFSFCYGNALSLDAGGSERIINGNLATENQFPYAASLQLTSQQANPTRGHRCGGVLITLQHMLTTSSCLFDNNNGTLQLIMPSLYQVFAGSFLITNTSPERVRPVANFTVHPDFLSSSFLNDIAIVTLLMPFNAAVVTPLPVPQANHDPADFTLCTVAGWGGTDNSINATQNLRFATKYTYNQNLCTMLYNLNSNQPNIMPSMLCAASFDSLSTGCEGDIGNALVCNGTLTGLLFYHGGCQPTTVPELYTRVNIYTTWIRSITGSGHTFAPGVLLLVLLSLMPFFTSKLVV